MLEESWLKLRAMSKRQLLLRTGALVFGLAALTLWVLEQAYLWRTPKFARLRPSFIVLDIFALSWVFLSGFLVRKLTRGNHPA